MTTAKIFKSGNSQAVRLPKEFQFEGSEVYIKRVGRSVVLIPKDAPWDLFETSLAEFTSDFMAEGRVQPPVEKRENW
ncbi:MAG: antitoxin [Acidobacteria bacterium]|nr:MAG: antitoxin [Acidobacteriota bacterium]